MPRKIKQDSPFAENLSTLLQEHELGVREASRIAGVSAGTISNWKSGTNPDDYLAVKRLATHLNVSLSWFLTGEEDSQTTVPSVANVFEDGGVLFDGYAKIVVQRLIPKKDKKIIKE